LLVPIAVTPSSASPSFRRSRNLRICSCFCWTLDPGPWTLDPAAPRATNKCGPGQPPGPHCFWRIFRLPYHARGAVNSSLAHSEERTRNKPGRTDLRRSLFAIFSATLRWPAASPAVCGGLCEEAATPGQPSRAYLRKHNPPKRIAITNQNAFLGNPPSDSPSRITRIR
jgi:hypothetical protein